MAGDRRGGKKLLVIIPLVIVAVLVVVPACMGLILAFKQYNPAYGLWGSPWVGMQNLQDFANTSYVAQIFMNTLAVTVMPHIAASLLAVLSVLVVGKISSAVGRGVYFSAILLLSFLPQQLLASVFQPSATGGATMDSPLYLLCVGLLAFMRVAGVAALAGGAGALFCGPNAGALPRFSGALFFVFAGLCTLFSPGQESFLMNTPLNQWSDTLLTFVYRQGLLNANFGIAGAASVLKWAVQLLLAAIAVLLVLFLVRWDEAAVPVRVEEKLLSAPGLVGICLGAALLVAGVISAAAAVPGGFGATLASLLMIVVGMIIFCAIAIPAALAAPAFKRPLAPALLLPFAALMGNLVAEYLFVRTLGLVNTLIGPAVMAARMLPLAAVIAWMFYAGGARALRFAVPLLALGASSILNNVIEPLVQIARADRFPLSLLARQQMVNAEGGGGSALLPLTLLSLAFWAVGCAFLFPGKQKKTV